MKLPVPPGIGVAKPARRCHDRPGFEREVAGAIQSGPEGGRGPVRRDRGDLVFIRLRTVEVAAVVKGQTFGSGAERSKVGERAAAGGES